MSVWATLPRTRAVEMLEAQVSEQRAGHSWLLLGPRGTGKHDVAIAMGAALVCPISPGRGCGECSACLRVLRGRFPDVHHIVPEGPVIPVDVVRESIVAEAARSPFEARSKVFVIEEADRMNPPAQNALLKTLEEPLADTFFVLLAEQEQELLDTVRSRCLVMHLEPIAQTDVAALLMKEGVDEDRAQLSARVAQGDIGRARSLARDDEAMRRRRLWLRLPAALGSATDALDAAGAAAAAVEEAVASRTAAQKDEIAELADAMGEGRGTASARNALAKRHKRELRRLHDELLGEALETIASFYRDIVAHRAGASDAVVNQDVIDDVAQWAASPASDEALMSAVERCATTRSAIIRNANPALALEAVFSHVAVTVGAPV